MLTEEQAQTLGRLLKGTCYASVVCAAFVVVTFVVFKAKRQSIGQVLTLSFCIGVLGLCTALLIPAWTSLDTVFESHPLCQTQAVLIQFFGSMAIVFWFAIAANLHHLVMSKMAAARPMQGSSSSLTGGSASPVPGSVVPGGSTNGSYSAGARTPLMSSLASLPRSTSPISGWGAGSAGSGAAAASGAGGGGPAERGVQADAPWGGRLTGRVQVGIGVGYAAVMTVVPLCAGVYGQHLMYCWVKAGDWNWIFSALYAEMASLLVVGVALWFRIVVTVRSVTNTRVSVARHLVFVAVFVAVFGIMFSNETYMYSTGNMDFTLWVFHVLALGGLGVTTLVTCGLTKQNYALWKGALLACCSPSPSSSSSLSLIP